MRVAFKEACCFTHQAAVASAAHRCRISSSTSAGVRNGMSDFIAQEPPVPLAQKKYCSCFFTTVSAIPNETARLAYDISACSAAR